MQRCLQLAAMGEGMVAPNPLVGAVLVYNGRIIGEGYHQKYGEAHAEVNCIASVAEADKTLIPLSVLYVSLEPCAHFGKTPPCADLIIKNRIPQVVIGCRDPFKEVDGKGIEKLKNAGVNVILNVLEDACTEINRRFFTFYTKFRPYIILKWAETMDGFMGMAPRAGVMENAVAGEIGEGGGRDRLLISNAYTNRVVHRWRSEEAGILVGTNTALYDNPELTTRLWDGPSPVRLVIDMGLRLPASLKLFNKEARTIIFNKLRQGQEDNLLYYQLEEPGPVVKLVVAALYKLKIQSVIVEGGLRLLQSFIDEQVWDEVRVIKNNNLVTGEGVRAPQLTGAERSASFSVAGDLVTIFKPAHL